MKKNLLALILVLAFAFSVVGCTPKPAESSQVNNTSKTALGETAEKQDYTAEEKVDDKTEAVVSETPVVSKKEDTNNNQTASKAPSNITRAEAKVIALKTAGAKESDIYDYEIDLDRENGVSVYEISFDSKGYEYDLHIRAEDGKVLKNIKEPEKEKASSEKKTSSKADSIISKAKAKDIALKAAGVKESEIFDYEIELDRDDGVASYEISFQAGNIEYEYDIKASDGKILKAEKDFDD